MRAVLSSDRLGGDSRVWKNKEDLKNSIPEPFRIEIRKYTSRVSNIFNDLALSKVTPHPVP